MRQEKTGSSVRKAKMSDINTNSTQSISNTGEKNNRQAPKEILFGFDEERESELGTVVERSSSAFSAIGNLDFKLPTQVATTLFEAGKWTTLAVGDAIGGILKDVVGSEKSKPQQSPDKQKKMEDGLALRQAMKVIENALAQNSYQERANSKQDEIRELGKSITVEESNMKLKRNLSYTGNRNGLSHYEIAEIRATETEEAKKAKKAEMQQTLHQTSKGANLSNRTDAQEGQSTTANAIASAG